LSAYEKLQTPTKVHYFHTRTPYSAPRLTGRRRGKKLIGELRTKGKGESHLISDVDFISYIVKKEGEQRRSTITVKGTDQRQVGHIMLYV
jgi:hypothetical protein